MKVYEIKREDVSVPQSLQETDPGIVERYVKLANGIMWECQEYGGYSLGFRNTIAVDLTVACYMLGLDVMDVVKDMIDLGVIFESDDDEMVSERFDRVLGYKHAFDWDWMIDPDDYTSYDEYPGYDDERMEILFKLVD